ncbi:MAG: bifunctional folylpolyglutamate synthase/dihydrofolate synthase [Clostridia bacterium]|nr:bifunctional folylpolyglutamate synthase/dihydrofolate synthase [Clostridia bacterium]
MNITEAIKYIEDRGWTTTHFGLSRTRTLLAALGDPQKKLKFVHVAGSNGKGSTSAMTHSILRQAGYKTGLYISPYIQKFNERIQVDGQCIPDDRLVEITERVAKIADAMDDRPTHFELVTAIGMEYFYEEKCDIVVLEVGMGGELDSTNAIEAPEVAVITNIGLEHTQWLGNTLEEIALTKSGIIKTGCEAVCYDGAPEVTEVVKQCCKERGVSLTCLDFAHIESISEGLDGQRFAYKGTEYDLALLGRHQLNNAAVVLEIIGALRRRGWDIDELAVRRGLRYVTWPARLEVLRREPLFLLDGGHNPQCVEALSGSLANLMPGCRFTFILGILSDKNYDQMADMLLPLAERFICLTPDSPRALPAEELAAVLRAKGADAESFGGDIDGALEKAASLGTPTVAMGSLYLAGLIRDRFVK